MIKILWVVVLALTVAGIVSMYCEWLLDTDGVFVFKELFPVWPYSW